MGWKSILYLLCSMSIGFIPISAEQSGEKEMPTILIENPATPINGTRVIELAESWRITEDPDEPLIGLIVDVSHDSASNICLLDYQMKTVWVYSKEGELIRRIGREGDGPGEFRRPNNIHPWFHSYLTVSTGFPPGFQLFDTNGDPIDIISLHEENPDTAIGGLFMFGSKWAQGHAVAEIYNSTHRDEIKHDIRRICAAAPDGLLKEVYYTNRHVTDLRERISRHEDELTWPESRWALFRDGRVCWVEGHIGYEIHMFEAGGRETMIIHRDYESLKRSPLEKRRAERQFEKAKRHGSNVTYVTSDYHRDIENIYARPDGSLWVMNCRGRWDLPEDAVAAFDVFDRDGRFIEEVILQAPGDLSNDRLYLLYNNVIIIYDFWDRAYRMGGTVTPDSDHAPGSSVDAMVICYSLNS